MERDARKRRLTYLRWYTSMMEYLINFCITIIVKSNFEEPYPLKITYTTQHRSPDSVLFCYPLVTFFIALCQYNIALSKLLD